MARSRLAQRHQRALLDPAAPIADLGVAHDLTPVADRLQIASDDLVEWRLFRAGDLDDSVSWRGERPPPVWHAHEMVFGYAAATVAGFLLTAIPNWTGRMPLQGGALATLVLLWVIGRLGVLRSGEIGAPTAAVANLSFPAVFLAVVL